MYSDFVNGSTIFRYACNESESCFSINTSLTRGFWKLECWGASGGSSYNSQINKVYERGRGGYSVGVLFVGKQTNIVLNIGGEGLSNASKGVSKFISGGYNGGGMACVGSSGWLVGSGGGATDIRLNGITNDDRIIVAGGGGGAGAPNSLILNGGFGGHGGGLKGLEGGGHGNKYDTNGGKGGTQHEGGLFGYYDSNQFGGNGSYGNGGTGGKSANIQSSSGGGGGGYYGGGGSNAGGGGGGSGYIGGVKSAYYVKAKTLSGDQVFPSPLGGTEKGHIGNGYIRITYVDPELYRTCFRAIRSHFAPAFIFAFTVLLSQLH